MSKKDEALKLALEALEGFKNPDLSPQDSFGQCELAITAIREALAEESSGTEQPAQGCEFCSHPLYAGTKCKNCGKPAQQEPVAWRNAALRVGEDLCSVGPFGYYDMTAEQWLDWALSVVTVHAPPARKPWVGLTLGDMYEIGEFKNTHGYVPTGFKRLATAIEEKLKEKNT